MAYFARHGVAARARCGFATYFRPGYEDHWVAEVHDPAAGRWRRVDPQIDAFQAETLSVDFDPTDLPPGRFVTGGEAWRLCRSGQADPGQFGIFHLRGLDFIRGNVVRDFLALNRIEVLPWDPWGMMAREGEDDGPAARAEIDGLAELTADPDANLGELQRLMAHHPALSARPAWWREEEAGRSDSHG